VHALVAKGCCGYVLQAFRDTSYRQAGQHEIHIASHAVWGVAMGHHDLVPIASCSSLLD